MQLNNEVIDSFIFCKYKAYLKLNENHGNKSDYELIEKELYKKQRENYLEGIKLSYHSRQIIYGALLIDIKVMRCPMILIDPEVKGDDFLISFDAIEISYSKTSRKKVKYMPIIITPKEKFTKDEKISLTVRTLLLNRVVNQLSETGKIIFGRDLKASSIKIKAYRRTAHKVIDELNTSMAGNNKPAIIRNDNCRICEFEESCKKHLMEKDDLSLLASFSPNEIIKRNKKGLFTINQLSYNFRPKRFKKIRERGRPFSYELKALSIRDNKTYILDLPSEINSSKTEIYMDFEGLPDENFVYLIGLIFKKNNTEEKISLWVASKEEEKKIFQKLIERISRFEDFIVYHYGNYEIKELKRAFKTYPDLEESIATKILENSVNLLSYFYSKVYTPTYTNELKEIGNFLGFKWSAVNASGIQSIAWRKKWELYGKVEYKNMLLRYNSEDCQALMVVKNWITKMHDGRSIEQNKELGYVKDIKVYSSYKFGKINYLTQDFEKINNCGYFNYQREKIFIKTNSKIKKIINKQVRLNKPKKVVKPNAHVALPTPKRCPNCGDKRKFYRHTYGKRVIEDLKFIKNGLRRWVTEYERGEFQCSKCFKIIPRGRCVQPFRENLYFWVINQYIAYGTSVLSAK